MVVSHIPDRSARFRCGFYIGVDMATKRGKEIENAVRALERLIDVVKEPETQEDLQMFVKFWTAYAICKADHTARQLEKSK